MRMGSREEKKSGTFLAVNDKVALLVSCGDHIRDPVPVRVLRQHRGNECVGSRVFGDKGPISDGTHTQSTAWPHFRRHWLLFQINSINVHMAKILTKTVIDLNHKCVSSKSIYRPT